MGVGRHTRWKHRWNVSIELIQQASDRWKPLETPVGSEWKAQPPMSEPKRSRCTTVTSPRFERRTPPGRHDRIFKVIFGTDSAASSHYKKTRMTIWRWRHDKAPLPNWVSDDLAGLIQKRVAEGSRSAGRAQPFSSTAAPPSAPTVGRHGEVHTYPPEKLVALQWCQHARGVDFRSADRVGGHPGHRPVMRKAKRREAAPVWAEVPLPAAG